MWKEARPELRAMSPDDALAATQSRRGGLTSSEVAERLATLGENRPPRARKRLGPSLVSQFTHFMALLVWVGGALAFVAGMPELGGAIWLVNLVNGAFAFWQEHRAQRATDALIDLIPQRARVLRDGAELEVQAFELVPGDILVLAEGDRISADALILASAGLQVTEAALTGESEAVPKDALPAPDDSASVSAGTAVLRGSGKALIVATGGETRLGAIATATQQVGETLSPLQKELVTATRRIAAIALGVGALFFLLAIWLAEMSVGEAMVFCVGMIVAFVPEGLLPTVTLALALSTQRMARRKALIRRLSAVETLGATSVICTDKTGTLTLNQMQLVEAVTTSGRLVLGGEMDHNLNTPVGVLFDALTLCNDAHIVERSENGNGPTGAEEPTTLGDPTEGALLLSARKLGLGHGQAWGALEPPRRVAAIPFDSDARRMSTLHELGGELRLYCKGAPSELIIRASHELHADGLRPLDEARRQAWRDSVDAMASTGLRVLGAAYRPMDTRPASLDDRESIERDLIFSGLVGLHDPPRPEVPDAIERCHAAGIRVVMMTGDHPRAAEHIARMLGLVAGTVRVVTGSELEALGEAGLADVITGDVVFARIAPIQKLQIVAAFQAAGYVVAVTGDGVNDAPALRKADIGVAMGRSGTDVARESADMVLLDDNFASIVAAVEEGRAVYSNIKRFTSYIFTSNVPEAIPFILFALTGSAIPLALGVMHILAIDLGTDLFPALALAGEPPERDAMHRPPRKVNDHIISGHLLARAYGFLGPIQALAVMAAFYAHYWLNGHWGQWLDLPAEGPIYAEATAMALGAVVMTQLGNLIAHRTEVQSSLRAGHNPLLLSGMLAAVLMLLLFIYVPPVADLIGLAPFPADQWLLLLTLVPTLFLADELRKAILRMSLRRTAASPPAP